LKSLEYKIVVGDTGFAELERKISSMLNEGWKPIGGLAFNNGFAHQAMARVKDESKYSLKERIEIANSENEKKPLTANEAIKRLNDLT
jgi:hypothetical protein